MADTAWWEVLGVERWRAASWHQLGQMGRKVKLTLAFKRAIADLKEVEEWTVVPLLNAYTQGMKEMNRG